ncbi:MAG: Trk system potassium transporter TrkA [Ruminiclostridium sp.]|nr:Trk system potassium transporter TrkA [Ruminiclostridium sp.]
MNIIIVGCGKVGQEITARLNEKGNNVTVIDIDEKKANDTTEKYDVMAVIGNGATHAVQQEAGIKTADLLIAVTGSDELNLLCCLIAKKAGNCQTIARVRSPEYSAEAPYLKEELGLAMVINPEAAAAAEIARLLRFPSAMKIDTFAKGRIELLKFRIPEDSILKNYAVKEISTKLHCDVLVCTVERGDNVYIANGDFVFDDKDVISIIATPRNANTFFKKIKYKTNQVRNTIIAGGGGTTHYLCEILLKSGIDVKIIERDEKRCVELNQAFPKADIVHGDASDEQLLMSEGLEDAASFVSMTNMDEENILLSLFAANRINGKVITKINRIEFDSVIKKLELDSIINPKSITAENIVRYVRAMKNTIGSNVQTLYSVIKDKVEAAEFVVKEPSRLLNTPIMELKFKDNLLIASITRDGKAIIPRGHDKIQIGDSVVVVSKHLGFRDITDILA